MARPRCEDRPRPQELTFECLACGGPAVVRLSRAGAWSWCRACRRVLRNEIALGPQGPVLLTALPPS